MDIQCIRYFKDFYIAKCTHFDPFVCVPCTLYAPVLLIQIKAHIIQPVNSLTIHTRNRMAVRVHGDLNRMVPELFLCICEAFIILDQKRGKRMSKVMYPDSPQIRFGQAFEKYPFPVKCVYYATFFIYKNQVRHLTPAFTQSFPNPFDMKSL